MSDLQLFAPDAMRAVAERGWSVRPLKFLFRRGKQLGDGSETLLSVYRDHGVVPKDSRDDNHNRASDDLTKYQLVRRGDLVVNKMKAWQGSVAVSSLDGTVSPAYFVYRPLAGIENRYAHYLLRTRDYFRFYAAISAGVRPGQWDLDPVAFDRMPVLLPSMRDQRQIADYLDNETFEIDAFIADLRAMAVLTQERFASELAAAMSGPYPRVNIRRVADMRTGHTPSRAVADYWRDTDIPWFTLADVWQLRQGNQFLGETKERVSALGVANSAAEVLPTGTVVLSRTASVGFTGIMPRPMATSQDFWNWVCGPLMKPEYLWNQFRAMKPEFERLKSGSTHKTIYQADAAAMAVVVPPVEVQAVIVEKVARSEATIKAELQDIDAAITLAKERRAALITAAVTGQIDVTSKQPSAVGSIQTTIEEPR